MGARECPARPQRVCTDMERRAGQWVSVASHYRSVVARDSGRGCVRTGSGVVPARGIAEGTHGVADGWAKPHA
jgi:hypothetical protein